MGRGIGESGVKVGMAAETFYDTQAFQYGVRDKWGYAFYQPKKDKEHKFFTQKPDSGLFIKAWEYVSSILIRFQLKCHIILNLGILKNCIK